jgi:sialate O-acetylesterase
MKAAAFFTDHMIFQQNKDIVVWGEGSDGEEVTVLFNGKSAKGIVKDGEWEVRLAPVPAGTYEELVIECGSKKTVIKDIAVGEVWLASGQSNMEFLYKYDEERIPDEMIEEDDLLRFYDVPEACSVEQEKLGHFENYGFWRRWKDTDAKWFSAVGAYFGAKLRKELNVPVGIIGINWGGCNAIGWTSPERAAEHPELMEIVNEYEEFVKTLDMDEYNAANDEAAAKDPAEGQHFMDMFMMGRDMSDHFKEMFANPDPEAQKKSMLTMAVGPKNYRRPFGLYEFMLKKVRRAEVAGALWYQGEEDEIKRSEFYDISLGAVIDTFRDNFGKDMPFLAVQLPPFEGNFFALARKYPVIREKIEKVADTVPNVWCSCSTDCGHRTNIHPRNKRPVGERLGLLALKHVYGKDIEADSPILVKSERFGGKVVLTFSHASSGLCFKGTELKAFDVFAEEYHVLPDVTVKGDQIVIEDSAIASAEEITVKYARDNYSEPNLYAGNGLPVFPFECTLKK